LASTRSSVYLCSIVSFGILLLSACGTSSQAPVTDKSAKLARYQASVSGPPPKYGYFYTVKKGDTLYSIAWAIKQDYRSVAAWNNIHSPYTIYIGQRLRLYPTRSSVTKRSSASASVATKKPATRSSRNTTSSTPATRPIVSTNSSSIYLGPVHKWIWPTRSHRIHARFSPSSGREGIDITGRKGDSIYSAADGQIVYAGSGLRGYGRLIIVKHNNTYLSAYAHNDRILVTEGQAVRGGQKIAEMGNGGTSRFKLHFEIRKKGTPVNPLKYFPKI
jgi:lipoprotein NlpD